MRRYQPDTSERKPPYRLVGRLRLHGRILSDDIPKKLQIKGDLYSKEVREKKSVIN